MDDTDKFLDVKVEHLPKIVSYKLQLRQIKISDVLVMPRRNHLKHQILGEYCSRCLGFSGRITSAKGKNASEKIHIILAKLMLVTDVGDKICCKQVLDVGDGFGHFGHQHTLFYQGLNFLINTQNCHLSQMWSPTS